MNKKRWPAVVLGLAAMLSLFGCKRDNQQSLSNLWVSFELSRSDSYYPHNFWITVENENGCYILKGECADEEGNTYRSEEGILLPDSVVKTLREFKLEELEALKKHKILDYFVLDAPTNKLLLIDSEGNQQEKSIGSELSMTIYRLVLPYFMENAG